MTFFDLILLLILFGFIWFGFWNGLIRTLGGIIGVILSVFIASRWYESLALKLLSFLGGNLSLARILAFIIVFAVAQFIIISLLKVVNKIFNLPILKTLNCLVGAVFGFIEGVLFIGLVLYFSAKLPLGSGWEDLLNSSKITPFLTGAGKILLPLIPEAVKQIKALM